MEDPIDATPASDDEIEQNEDLPVFSIPLGPAGDKGSGLHIQNDPNNRYQRERVIDREGAVNIRCSCVDIIHGLFAEDGEFFSTLLVLEFRFDPRKRARRLAHVDIELRFSGIAGGGADPDVYAIAPDGRISFAQTTQTEETAFESDLHIGGRVAGADAGGSVKYGRNVTREMSYATTVVGSIDLRGRNYGKPNSASWTLMENPETKSGVPISMKTAILLKRRDEGEFQCVVSLIAKADWRTNMEWLVGTTKPDDPVLIDPTKDPTSKRYSEMELKLGELNLDTISDITVMNVMEGVVKTRKIGGDELSSGKVAT